MSADLKQRTRSDPIHFLRHPLLGSVQIAAAAELVPVCVRRSNRYETGELHIRGPYIVVGILWCPVIKPQVGHTEGPQSGRGGEQFLCVGRSLTSAVNPALKA